MNKTDNKVIQMIDIAIENNDHAALFRLASLLEKKASLLLELEKILEIGVKKDVDEMK